MHYVLAVVFAFSGIGGLIYQAEIGVFAGLGLLPWQLARAGVPRRIYQLIAAFCMIAGLIFFLLAAMWLWFFAFIIISLYNVWGYFRFYREKKTGIDREN